ncbi:unnamed protein product, partial [Scytosiphon promiscuus]
MISRKTAAAASVLLGNAALSACNDPAPARTAAPETAPPENSLQIETDRALTGNEVSTSVGVRILTADKRVAVLAGHIEAGLVLYHAGAPDLAAAQLNHAVSLETQ